MKGARIFALIVVALTLLWLASSALAETEAFSLAWWTVDSGGGISSEGSFSLAGTMGQAEAGGMSGEQFELSGGFWPMPVEEPSPTHHELFLPVLLKP